jgi:hypothetical protein
MARTKSHLSNLQDAHIAAQDVKAGCGAKEGRGWCWMWCEGRARLVLGPTEPQERRPSRTLWAASSALERGLDFREQVVFQADDTKEDFREINQVFFSFFYAPWCGHCKKKQARNG